MISLLASILLITTTGDGVVHHEWFTTKRECDEAVSVVLYGKSIERRASDDKAQELDAERYRAEYLKEHPCHKPKSKEGRALVKEYASGVMSIWGGQYVSNGLVCEIPVVYPYGNITVTNSSQVKTAECIEDAK